MQLEHPYLIRDVDGFSPHISRRVTLMSYARQTTLEAVAGLSARELDARPHGVANSIGRLLEHIAAVEVWYGANTFENRDLSEAELSRWEPGLELGKLGRERIHGYDLGYYLATLAAVREATLTEFARRDYIWLERAEPFFTNSPPTPISNGSRCSRTR